MKILNIFYIFCNHKSCSVQLGKNFVRELAFVSLRSLSSAKKPFSGNIQTTSPSYSSGTSAASAMNAFHHFAFFKLALRHSTNAVRLKVGVPSLDTTKAAQILIALLLPFGDQVRICYSFFHTIVIQFPTNGFPPIEQVIHIA